MLEDAGQTYEEVNVSGPEWLGGKKKEYLTVPFIPYGFLPILEHDGLALNQTSATLRYLAKIHGYYGGDAKTQWLCDAVEDGINKDWKTPYNQLAYPSDPSTYPEQKAKYIAETHKKFLTLYETVLGKTEGGQHFIAGKEITFADFSLWEVIDISNSIEPGCLERDYPLLAAYHKRIAERPNIKAYFASSRRPKLVNLSEYGV